MRTKRDQDIINFLSEFFIGTSGQIHKLFFPNITYRYSRKRLEYLTKQGWIKRTKSTIDNCIAYYIDKKPSQIHHHLLRAELYANLSLKYKILEWTNETTVVNIRPDAMAYINDHDIPYPVFVEIHLSNKFDFDKYKELVRCADLKAMYGVMPRVIICTDRDITIPNNIGIKFKVVGIDMTGLDTIFK